MSIVKLLGFLLFVCFINLSFAQGTNGFEFTITGDDGISPTKDVIIGMNPSAQDGEDAFDTVIPPFPPGGVFYFCSVNGDKNYSKDIRLTNPSTYTIGFQLSTGSSQITLSWDNSLIQNLGTMLLDDLNTGPGTDLDMMTTDTYTPVIIIPTIINYVQITVNAGADDPLPVELTVFEVRISNGNVVLNWMTESELNNLGFEVWRSSEENGQYTLLSDYSKNPTLEGQGSTSIQHEYSYIDESVVNGQTYWYKIADVDFNGNRTFHEPKSVAIPLNSGNISNIGSNTPENFKLYQNFPNPFNPNTTIQFDIPSVKGNLANVRLIVFNNIGQMVNTIYQGKLTGGSYQVQWDGTNDLGNTVSSGIYYAFVNVNNSSQTLKMILLR